MIPVCQGKWVTSVKKKEPTPFIPKAFNQTESSTENQKKGEEEEEEDRESREQ